MLQKKLAILLLIGLSWCDTSISTEEQEKKRPKNGLIHTYNEDGSISASINYKEGIRHGLPFDYYTDGKLRAEIDYVYEVKKVLAKWFYKNGKVFRTTAYLADEREGFQKKYYEGGELISEIEFHNNDPELGLREFNKSCHERKTKVDFIFGDPIHLNNGSATMELRLSNKVKEVTLYQGVLKDNKFLPPGLTEINKTANTGFVNIPKGQDEVVVISKYKTRLKNYRVVQGTAKR